MVEVCFVRTRRKCGSSGLVVMLTVVTAAFAVGWLAPAVEGNVVGNDELHNRPRPARFMVEFCLFLACCSIAF